MHDDTLVEIKSGTLNLGSSVAKVNVTIWLKKLTNLLWSDDRTKLTLNEEETFWELVNMHHCVMEESDSTMSLGLLASARTTLDQTTTTLLDGALSMLRLLKDW